LDCRYITSPITAALVIAPVVTLKNVGAVPPQPAPVPPRTGSQFGRRKGFTPRTITGTKLPPGRLEEFDGLNPSAVAVAETLNATRLQIREKNVGRLGRFTVTATSGLIPNVAGAAAFGNVTVTSVDCTCRAAIAI
jgi:hypothetical protein